MKTSPFPFTLLEIRNQVDDDEIGFHLQGDKAKPVHFAIGLFRQILGEYSSDSLLCRMVWVVNAKGEIPKGSEIDGIMPLLSQKNSLVSSISKEQVQQLRTMMQPLLNADSAVFGNSGSSASFSAASAPFVTAKARYEEVGELAAQILNQACPKLLSHIRTLLNDRSDEISMLFDPIMVEERAPADLSKQLPKWTERAKNSNGSPWEEYLDSVRQSGLCLLTNIKNQPKLLAIRTFVLFSIFHLLRYLVNQERFHARQKGLKARRIPFLAVYDPRRNTALVQSSHKAFLQIGQSLSRFYAESFAQRLKHYQFGLPLLLKIKSAPQYTEKDKPTKSDLKKALQNDEVWKEAQVNAKADLDQGRSEQDGRLRFGQAIEDMVATASGTSPLKYIRGIATKAGILYPLSGRSKPYFRFSQDVTAMLVQSTVHAGECVDNDDFLDRLRGSFDVVTGANSSDYDFCRENIVGLGTDENAVFRNGEAFIEQVCEMGYGRVLADGIFQVEMGA